uniref:Uncharacterized protein n=1 Tax=viral metagenome TaxID=1070528 RepID=A0A6M3IXH5_9ZZZZ
MLNEESRQKLDSIVAKMVENNESDDTIQLVVNDFKTKYDESNKSPILSGVEALVQPSKEKVEQLLKPTDTITKAAQEPRETAKKLLTTAQYVGGISPFSGITTTPTTEFGIQKLRGKSTKEAGKEALKAAAWDVGLTAATLGFPLAKQVFKKGAKKAVPLITETLTGVPREATGRALGKEFAGKSILKGKIKFRQAYNTLGRKAQDAINYVKTAAGKAVGNEAKALEGIKTKFDFSDVTKNIDDAIAARSYGGRQTLSSKDMNKIIGFQNEIAKTNSPARLYSIKRSIDDTLKYATDAVKPSSEAGEAVLKETRNLIQKKLTDISPKFAEASNKYHKVKYLQDQLKTQLKDMRVAKNLKDTFAKDKAYEELFRNLDDLAPKKYKFVSKLEDIIAAEQLNKLAPTIGSEQAPLSLGLIFRGGIGMGSAGTALPLFSPKVHKQLIRGMGKYANIKPTTRAALKDITLGLRRGRDNSK